MTSPNSNMFSYSGSLPCNLDSMSTESPTATLNSTAVSSQTYYHNTLFEFHRFFSTVPITMEEMF